MLIFARSCSSLRVRGNPVTGILQSGWNGAMADVRGAACPSGRRVFAREMFVRLKSRKIPAANEKHTKFLSFSLAKNQVPPLRPLVRFIFWTRCVVFLRDENKALRMQTRSLEAEEKEKKKKKKKQKNRYPSFRIAVSALRIRDIRVSRVQIRER